MRVACRTKREAPDLAGCRRAPPSGAWVPGGGLAFADADAAVGFVGGNVTSSSSSDRSSERSERGGILAEDADRNDSLNSVLSTFLPRFCPTRKPNRKRSVFEGVVPSDDMHETFRMSSGAQKRRQGRYTHVLGSPSVRGANRCVCAPKRRTQPRLKFFPSKRCNGRPAFCALTRRNRC